MMQASLEAAWDVRSWREKMEAKQILNVAVLAGEIMLRSGAETYRVEDTMKHILKTAGTEVAEAFVMMTGIVATVDGPDMEMITAMRRVHDRGTNMYRIVRVNEISRKYCSGEMTLDETYEALKKISGKQYSVTVYNLATILVAVGFVPLFGGSFLEILISAVVGCVVAALFTLGKKVQMSGFILNTISAAGVAISAIWLKRFLPGWDLDIVIISSLMPLVPGVAITNAIRDTLRGDYISGGARILEAFMTAAAIGLGAGVGMTLMGILYPGGGML